MLNKSESKNIFIAGHNGLVGSAVHKELAKNTTNKLILADRSELDLLSRNHVQDYFDSFSIDEIYLCAAKVGGIKANNEFPAEFIYENLAVQTNVIDAAHKSGVERLLFLGSSCIYPKLATQPIKETQLLQGSLEPTNEPYAIAKIAGIKLCEAYNRQYGMDYRSVMPTNLYGPNDNFHAENSHVIPSLIRRFHAAKVEGLNVVEIWGSGRPMREFLHVQDMAAACVYVMGLPRIKYQEIFNSGISHINIGSGIDCTIADLAFLVAKTVGFNGEIRFDTTKPDGTPRKLLDVSLLKSLGWEATIGLESGLKSAYHWYKENLLETLLYTHPPALYNS